MKKKLCFILLCGVLLAALGSDVGAAGEPLENVHSMLAFANGSGFFSKNNGIVIDNADGAISLTVHHMGTTKEAAYGEIPLVVNGIGLEVSPTITGLKATSDSKALKVSYDKKNEVLRLTSAGLGKGTITVSGVVKEGKESTLYTATLPFVVRPAAYSHSEIGLKEKGSKEVTFAANLPQRQMVVGESIALQVRFFNDQWGYFTYGGVKNSGLWQSLDPGYLQVSNDGKLKALTPTADGTPARAVFIDYLGNTSTTVEVVISPKPNGKLDRWGETLQLQAKASGKNGTLKTVSGSGGSLTWNLSDGPFQLSAMVTDNKDKQVKANVFYFTSQPDYAVIDAKGICTPLKASGSVSIIVTAVAKDALGPKLTYTFPLTIVP